MIKVRVPATSANVGAGFDSLGLAVSLYNEFTFEEAPKLEIVSLDGALIPKGPSNLVYRSAKAVFDQLDIPMPGLRITQQNAIPMARGLGSSSSCIVAGILGANAMLGNKLTPRQMLTMATVAASATPNKMSATIHMAISRCSNMNSNMDAPVVHPKRSIP